jgi:nitrilase/beta-cyano-L-alanine hydratase/nitrilase
LPCFTELLSSLSCHVLRNSNHYLQSTIADLGHIILAKTQYGGIESGVDKNHISVAANGSEPSFFAAEMKTKALEELSG